MRTTISVEHIVLRSHLSFQKLQEALEMKLGKQSSMEEVRGLMGTQASWEIITQAVESGVGESGFVLFFKTDHSLYLQLAGGNTRACRYAIGNPLLAIAMTSHVPEAGLYAPLSLVVWENTQGTFLSYDSIASLISQYGNEQATAAASVVEEKLQQLIEQLTLNDDELAAM
jgi:uncharacterized protein (DUF302 family)